MWVLHKHMLTDQQPSVYSHVTEQRHMKRSYDGTFVNELDVLLCERPHTVVGSYQVGDVVSYRREARAGEHGLQWSVGSRLIGFEKDRNSLGEAQLRTCPSVLPLIVYVLAHQRNCSLSTAREPKVHHLSRQTPRHNKASSMNVFRSIRQLLTHHEMPMKVRTKISKTRKCWNQHN